MSVGHLYVLFGPLPIFKELILERGDGWVVGSERSVFHSVVHSRVCCDRVKPETWHVRMVLQPTELTGQGCPCVCVLFFCYVVRVLIHF